MTLIGAEKGVPYNRVGLSTLLAGDIDEAGLRTPPHAAVAYRSATRVAAIERRAKMVRLESGEGVAYDRLVLATGSRAVPPPPARCRPPRRRALPHPRRRPRDARCGRNGRPRRRHRRRPAGPRGRGRPCPSRYASHCRARRGPPDGTPARPGRGRAPGSAPGRPGRGARPIRQQPPHRRRRFRPRRRTRRRPRD